jgi:hypothetical protein
VDADERQKQFSDQSEHVRSARAFLIRKEGTGEQQDRRMKIPQIMQLGVQEQFASAATVPFEVRRR